MSAQRIFIVGATSAIATAFARRAAIEGASFVLASRNQEACRAIADDLIVRGAAAADLEPFDAHDISSHGTLADRAWQTLGGVDVALIAHGSLPDQLTAESSIDDATWHITTNVTGSASVLGAIANHLENQGHGSLVVISSVAGDRGRKSNYIYGASKAFLNTFLDGLRHRMHENPVHIMTVKPGFVDTPMTEEFEKGPLWATPDRIASDIARGIRRGSSVIYTPWYWRWIMRLIRMLPEWIMHKTNL